MCVMTKFKFGLHCLLKGLTIIKQTSMNETHPHHGSFPATVRWDVCLHNPQLNQPKFLLLLQKLQLDWVEQRYKTNISE